MINEDPNMGRKQIFTELPLPSKVEEKGILTLIYKGVFIVVKLLLDIRLNLVKISEGKTIKTKFKQGQENSGKPDILKPDNPIKGLDNIKIDPEKMETIKKGAKLTFKNKKSNFKLEEGSVRKGGVNQVSDTNKSDFTPTGQKPIDDNTVEVSNEVELELKTDGSDGVNDKSPDEEVKDQEKK